MLRYEIGDVTKVEPPVMIAHVCNDIGLFGAGVARAIANRWPAARERYRQVHQGHGLALGAVLFVEVEEDPSLMVANMIAQRGVRGPNNPVPLDYEALKSCLEQVRYAVKSRYSVAMPRIGCGLAGGTWAKVGPMVSTILEDVDVTVYDLEKPR